MYSSVVVLVCVRVSEQVVINYTWGTVWEGGTNADAFLGGSEHDV